MTLQKNRLRKGGVIIIYYKKGSFKMSSIIIKEEDMKKLLIVLMGLFVFSVPAYAQMGMTGGQQGQMGQGMMMGEGQQMQMMCPKMQQMPGQGMMQGGQQMPMMQMMGQGMMMQDMMQMMMDMMNMQEKMMMGVKAADKKKMAKDITQMKEKMQKMMSMCKGMIMGGMMGQPSDVSQCRLTCAEQWLKKAIDLHEIHIKDPKTATEASQMEMMDQMKKAYDCLREAPCKMTGTPSKESGSKEAEKEKTPKGDIHGH